MVNLQRFMASGSPCSDPHLLPGGNGPGWDASLAEPQQSMVIGVVDHLAATMLKRWMVDVWLVEDKIHG